MQKLFFIIAFLFATPAHAEINVFACEPEWKSLAEKIGGKNITAISATSYKQDPHFATARPGLLAAMRKADLVICSGAGLEVGWLPVLLQKSGSTQTQTGGKGNLMAADYVLILEKPQTIDRSNGDVHPEGNPHIHLNPYNILKVGNELAKRFEATDPSNKALYQQNWNEFETKWKQKISIWEKQAAPLKNMAVITHHNAWAYLFDWLKIKQVATLEDKPGIPPSTSHLEELVNIAKTQRPAVIIRSAYNPTNASEWLSEKTGVKATELPFTVNEEGKPQDIIALFDQIINSLGEYARQHDD